MIPPGISEHSIGNANPILFAAGLAAAVDCLIDDTAAGEGIAGKIVVTVFPGNIKAAENIRISSGSRRLHSAFRMAGTP